MMQAAVLASGSNGNSVYLETENTRLLVDSGVSARKIHDRLMKFNRSESKIDAILITHDHLDHVYGVRVLARKFGVPVFLNQPTREKARRALRGVNSIEIVRTGEDFNFKDVHIQTIPVPHDSAEAMGFVVTGGGVSLGVFTDLGTATPAVERAIPKLDALVLETNYDPELLRNGPYPKDLQARIRGEKGHLSNEQAADLCGRLASPKLQVVYCAHLSAENNSPNLAYREMRRKLSARPDLRHVRVLMTSRRTVSRMTTISA